MVGTYGLDSCKTADKACQQYGKVTKAVFSIARTGEPNLAPVQYQEYHLEIVSLNMSDWNIAAKKGRTIRLTLIWLPCG